MIAWRASPDVDLSGRQAEGCAGRWHDPPRRVVYLSLTPEGALLEALAQCAASDEPPPETLQILKIEIPDSASLRQATSFMTPEACLDERHSRPRGSDWLDAGREAVLLVPSALMPLAENALLNPAHPDARSCRITGVFQVELDRRLARRR